MRRILIILFLLFIFLNAAEARHIAGGEMSYEYLGPGSGTNLRYRIILKLYRDCNTGGALLDNNAAITIYPSGSSTAFTTNSTPLLRVDLLSLGKPDPCIDNPPIVCYEVGIYNFDVELPISAKGYDVSYQRCCRIDNITNIINSGAVGATYTARIPGTDAGANAPSNSSARFDTKDTVVICEGNPFQYDFKASDADGDDLSYEFDEAYDGASLNTTQPSSALAPPYFTLPYTFGFTYSRPMGTGVSINPVTGLVSGVAPNAGIYVITVTVVERRNGVIINRHRKDLHIKVASCSLAAADLPQESVNCKDLILTFRNNSSSSLIKTYSWDFGLPGAGDTSSLAQPVFTYPDTGTYLVRLITNRNLDCSDTAFTLAKIYPGFNPKFQALDGCPNAPITFRDQSTAAYGTVNYWKWFFGNPIVNQDTSRLQNPSYTYPNTGNYNVQLIVGTSKGCRDTIDAPINILTKPQIQRSRDTLICTTDTLRLIATGNGSFSWSPNYMINNINSATPLVSPDVPTKYYVTLTSAPGCVNTDSVFVDVRASVTLNAGPDTTICLTDSLRFNISSDGIQYQWTPGPTISDPTLKNPVARPTGTTTYTVRSSIGSCSATDNITVFATPYPTASVSPDTSICYRDSIRLFASGGVRYTWTPASGLSAANIPDPLAFPLSTTVYRVAVFDNKGCPKPSIDSVRIRVIPQVLAFAGNDTAIVLGQPLQLNATGGTGYRWSPGIGLSNTNISNPVATLSGDITYLVRVNTPEGCFAFDTMNVKVFYTGPEIFVPTGFTPNNDKRNDLLKPIPVGIASLDHFKVYNRYGQLVFSTSVPGQGWDGKINGVDQNTGTYAWYVQGTDYLGKKISRKGTSTLIR